MATTVNPAPRVQPTGGSSKQSELDLQARWERINRLGDWLDSAIELPGIGYRIGWDTIIGLAPGIGDLITTAMSAWIINEARHLGVSRFTLARMITNTSFDALLGSVPIAGDLFDAVFKSNVKNLDLLRKSLKKRGMLSEEEESPTVRVIQP